MQPTQTQTKSLTLFRRTDSTILGELSDAVLREEHSAAGSNWVLSGMASDGTIDDLTTFLDSGNDTVLYEFMDGNTVFAGEAQVLQPSGPSGGAGTEVRIETPFKPARR